MRVLLVHPEDGVPAGPFHPKLDLIVDLARAPRATYERWAQETQCPVISVFDFVDSIADLTRLVPLLRNPKHALLDEHGINWWDTAAYLVVDGLLDSLLLHRLAGNIGANAELISTRPDRRVEFLCAQLSGSLVNLTPQNHAVAHRFGRYRTAVARLDAGQIAQIIGDKWDPQHQVRRRFGRRKESREEPVILLPSAYVNISRTAIAFAKLLPHRKFVLVHARRSGKLAQLPLNVDSIPLHPYYEAGEAKDLPVILDRWKLLREELASSSEEMGSAEFLGAMDAIPGFIKQGLAARDAWRGFFASHNVMGCLSADINNVYSRIPLLLAEQAGLPTVACHHGALNYGMAIATHYGNAFLAKSKMETDYLTTACRIPREKIIVGGPATPSFPSQTETEKKGGRPWLVFFTEPYAAEAWRIQEVYRGLLPELVKLSRACHLQLVMKLHPFESVKEHKNLSAKLLSPGERERIKIVGGTLSEDDWEKIHCAITVQSSVAVECALRNIPIFLCAWLQARYGGYIAQFAKFGAGSVVDRPQDLMDITRRLGVYRSNSPAAQRNLATVIEPSVLEALLSAKRTGHIPYELRTI